jgi:hypothetical protein
VPATTINAELAEPAEKTVLFCEFCGFCVECRHVRLPGSESTASSHMGVAEEAFAGMNVGGATQVFVPMMMQAHVLPGWQFLDDRRSRFAHVCSLVPHRVQR